MGNYESKPTAEVVVLALASALLAALLAAALQSPDPKPPKPEGSLQSQSPPSTEESRESNQVNGK
jgi:hypothetical protein